MVRPGVDLRDAGEEAAVRLPDAYRPEARHTASIADARGVRVAPAEARPAARHGAAAHRPEPDADRVRERIPVLLPDLDRPVPLDLR
ncbi:MAG: hypothetical protein ACK55I_44290, partial [bacterium]